MRNCSNGWPERQRLARARRCDASLATSQSGRTVKVRLTLTLLAVARITTAVLRLTFDVCTRNDALVEPAGI